jgi:MFS family permease
MTSDVVQPTAEAVATPPLRRDWMVLGWAIGEAVSNIGDQVWLVGLAYTAVRLGSPAFGGTVLACAALPRAALMLFGGAVTDRFDARRLMLWSNLVRTLILIGGIAIATAYGVGGALLIGVGLLFGVADAFYSPASRALPRQLVAKKDLGRLASTRQLFVRAALFVGAPLGGLLTTQFGLRGAMLVDAISFLVIAAILTRVRPRWSWSRERGKSMLADIRGGLAYLGRARPVRSLVIALSGLNVFVTPVTVVGVALRSSQAGWGPTGLGVLTGAIGVGAGVGTVVSMFWRQDRPVRTGLSLLLAQAVALGLIPLGSFTLALGAMIVIGLTAGLASPMLAGAFQATVAAQYLGRVGALVSITDSGLTPFTLAGFGLLATSFGVQGVSLAFAVVFLVLIGLVIARPDTRAIRLDGTTEQR